jgi:hypothetical protein
VPGVSIAVVDGDKTWAEVSYGLINIFIANLSHHEEEPFSML